MANTFNIDELDSDAVHVTATIEQKDYAYSLLYSSGFNDEQRDKFDNELSDSDMTIEKLDSIIYVLKMNQSDSPNPSVKEINKLIDTKMALDGD